MAACSPERSSGGAEAGPALECDGQLRVVTRTVDAPDDLRLSEDSDAAIDAGEFPVDDLDLDELGVEFPDTDLAGQPRIVDGDGSGEAVIDLGAYEYQP